MFFLLASTNPLTNFANSRVNKPNVSLTEVLRCVLILFRSIFSIFALSFFFEEQTQLRSTKVNKQRGESYFPYILLNEIQTMFSQFAKRLARVLPADLCTDHAHYVKNHRSTVFNLDPEPFCECRGERSRTLGNPGARLSLTGLSKKQ